MDKRDLIVQAAIDRCPVDAYIGTPPASKVVCGYIMGATGWICTQARLDAQAKQYPDYAAKIYKYGPQWIGIKCYDCAQLTRTCAEAAGYKLVSGATSQWNQDTWEDKGTIDTLPADSRGIMLFRQDGSKMAHVAVCLGDGTEAEALGHQYGVVRRSMAGRSFTHWAKLRDLDVGTTPTIPDVQPETPKVLQPTLSRGAQDDMFTGPYVSSMQQRLLIHGIKLPRYGVDGDFGRETETAVKQFQGLHGLTVDGVCGPWTWAALLKEPEVNPPAEDLVTVIIPGITKAQADALLATWPGSTMSVG